MHTAQGLLLLLFTLGLLVLLFTLGLLLLLALLLVLLLLALLLLVQVPVVLVVPVLVVQQRGRARQRAVPPLCACSAVQVR
eukprot:COSAG02_NODE_357_length_23913_cov_6.793483_6_plen_81_part_00